VDFTATFSEDVTGVDKSDFFLFSNNTTATGTISAVSGSGTSYTVSVTGVSGNGTLRLDLNASGTGIKYKASSAVDISGAYTGGTLFSVVPLISAIPTSSSVTTNSAVLGGEVLNTAETITERGVVFAKTSENANPVIGGTGVTKIVSTVTTAQFTVDAAGLTRDTGYSYKAYAISAAVGTKYSDVGTFTTLASILKFRLEQKGTGVLMTVSGNINTTRLLTTIGATSWSELSRGNGDSSKSYIGQSDVFGFTPTSYRIYTGAFVTVPQGPVNLPSLVATALTPATIVSTTSAFVGINNNPRIALDSSYVSDSEINGTSLFSDQTFADLFAPGSEPVVSQTYLWTLPNNDGVMIEVHINTAPVATDVKDTTNEDTAKEITLAATYT
jgi:hypothetical protein